MRILNVLFALVMMSAPAAAQVTVDYNPPPATEAELFNRALLVIRGRIESRTIDADEGSAKSIYAVRVLEVLKAGAPQSVGGLVNVHRPGGLEAGKGEGGFPTFEVNEEIVLFLERRRNGSYWPMYGPDGAFKLQGGRTIAYGKLGEVSKRHQGRSADEFLAEVRKHKK